MSIGIAIAVPDGIALAADSQTTWNQAINRVKEKISGREVELAEPINVPVGWSRMARKLFSIDMNGTPYAVITAGMAHMNTKSMYAVIHSGTRTYTDSGSINKVGPFIVNHLKNELSKHLSCKTDQLDKQPVNVCEIILATYEDKDVAKPVIESHLVFSGTLQINGKNDS